MPFDAAVGLLMLIAFPVSVAYGYFRAERLGDLASEDSERFARDLLRAVAERAPGPWSSADIQRWVDTCGLTPAQVIQVQRRAQHEGWLRLPRRSPVSIAFCSPEYRVWLTTRGYDMHHGSNVGPSIQFAGPVIGNTTIAQAGGDQNAELRVHEPQATATESVAWPDLISALRRDVPSLATYDRAAVTQMINDLDEAGPSGPEPSRATEILGWLRDKVGTRLAAQAADGMWSATKEYLETYVGG
ncbi:hypothetical protein ACIP5Y_06965 [Nocardia sp. NPDC088792]|uniref:hypothetical protein n=1 Tax=Nocardia sp. NPDC088792 TaxID=3364332 RepID=UPI0038161A4F